MSAADIEWVDSPEGVTEFWEDILLTDDTYYEWDDRDKAFEDAIEFSDDDIEDLLMEGFEMEYDDTRQDDLRFDSQDDFDSDYYL